MGWPQDRKSARIAPRAISLYSLLAACLGASDGAWAQPAPRYESVVQARSSSAPHEDAAADASVVTDERTPRAGESVAQLVAELPGVTVNRLGGLGSVATLSLRGSTWAQVAVYVDGVPLNSGVGGGVDLSTLPLGDVERIEVYRGASPLAFGGSALGGIVSITTRAPRASGVDAELGAGSFETESAGVSGSFVHRRVRVYAGAHLLNSVGDFPFITDNGTAFNDDRHEVTRLNNAVTQVDGVLRVVIPIDAGRQWTSSALVFERDQGLPGYGSVRQTTRTSLDTLRLIGSAVYDSRRDLGANGRLRAQVYALVSRQRYDDPLAEISISPASTEDWTYSVGANVHLEKTLVPWLRLSAILDGRDELFRPYDAAAHVRIAPSTRLFGGLGVEADAAWDRLRLHVIPSLRVEVAHDARAGRDTFGVPLPPAELTNVVPSARLALQGRATRTLTLRANAARYARIPSLTELYGNSGFLIGNSLLTPESGWNADLGAHLRLTLRQLAIDADAALFASFVDDLIQYQQDAYGRARAANIGRARIVGVEASLLLELVRYGRLQLSGTFTDARDVSDTSIGQREPALPNRARFHFYARPEGRLPIRELITLGAYVEVDVTDGNYLDPANLVALPSRVLVGAGLFAEIPRAQLRLITSAQNLGDSHVFDFAGFPLPGRAFFVSAHFTYRKEKP